MNLFVLPVLLGNAPAAADGAPAGVEQGIFSFLPFVLIIAIFYFLIIRPQNKKQKETQKMLEALKKGDKVVTIGGVYGVIQNVKEKTVVIKVDDDTKIEFLRSAVSSVVDAAKLEEKSESRLEEKPASTESKEKKDII
jgi:preprotein translocase subunit YajC